MLGSIPSLKEEIIMYNTKLNEIYTDTDVQAALIDLATRCKKTAYCVRCGEAYLCSTNREEA